MRLNVICYSINLMNRKFLILISFFFCLTATNSWSLDYKDLSKKDGIYYKKSSNIPFTGNIIGDSKGSFKNGLKEGYWESYWDNGELRVSGYYKNGQRTGIWQGYHPEKKLVFKNNHKDNKKLGSWVHVKQIMFKGEYINGKKEGTWYWYWLKAGVMKAEPKEYKNGIEINK